MLYQVLHAIEQTQGPVRVQELAERLGIEPGALEGMIAYWVRKGRLQDLQVVETEGCAACGTVCAPGLQRCVFDNQARRTYTLVCTAPPKD